MSMILAIDNVVQVRISLHSQNLSLLLIYQPLFSFLERGFASWKAMLEGASDKLKEHGMTVIYAGTSIADDNSLTVIIDFASQEGMMNFANDEEAKAARAEAGVLLDTIVMTPMTDSSVTNFSG